MTGNEKAYEALDALLNGPAGDSPAVQQDVLLVSGAPGTGKTEYAFEALVRGLKTYGDDKAVMTVSNRVIADGLADRVIRRIGASSQVRPVTTLSALAYRVLAAVAFDAGAPAPKLLNGAEQDALLRKVLATHLMHARTGDLCPTCLLLRSYFADDGWTASVVTDDRDGAASAGEGDADTVSMLERGISAAFVGQLRDMLARMDELGVDRERESLALGALRETIGAAGRGHAWRRAERLDVQWRLTFALRREYERAIGDDYRGQYRLDASRLLVDGAAALRDGARSATSPALLVVDDFQDTTLAGLRFLEALHRAGTRLLLVGNPDEAVQTFRGSYPEYVFGRAVDGVLKAKRAVLSGPSPEPGAPSYRDLVVSRVALSIPSPENEMTALPDRPGKPARWEGSLPITPVGTKPDDTSLRAALYRSPREELDDVVWRIKRTHLDFGEAWNTMAVIAHDNATVRMFGERLRRDGVPVRYSSVTRPLRDEPFVQGLFSLIELARLRRQGIMGCLMAPEETSRYVRSRVASLMACPLITTGAKPGEGRPARLAAVESAMNALVSLADILPDDARHGSGEPAAEADDEIPGAAGLSGLTGAWREMARRWYDAREARSDASGETVDDSLIGGSAPHDEAMGFSTNALYVMLAFDDAQAPASDIMDMIAHVMGRDPQIRAWRRLWHAVGAVAAGLDGLESREPQYVLSLAWDAMGVAGAWQTAALANTSEGRAANDRLDAAMRLFQYAEGGTAGHDIVAFAEQVRSMQIEADSLAHVGPVEQAVTLSTPAGAVGRHWTHVWMPALQQGVWPNLAERGTLFGGDDLADIMLHGEYAGGGLETSRGMADPRLTAVLSSEKKGLLVALTRAIGASATVTVSAVRNDDLTPSDFLYGYMPERFDRGQADYTGVGSAAGAASDAGSTGGEAKGDERGHGYDGLDADPRGLVAAARITLARDASDDAGAKDAARALALLARHGIESAEPENWSFPTRNPSDRGDGDDVASATQEGTPHGRNDGREAVPVSSGQAHPVATLSPSAVDRIWDCPVCWMLENRFAGPRPGSVAAGFGTLIHAVAQQGSEEGLDMPGFMAGSGREERTEAVLSRLRAIYEGLRPDPDAVGDPADRYAMIRKDADAETALAAIAGYFVSSNEPDYLGRNGDNFDIGTLERADCEEEFTARITLARLLPVYNGLPGMHAVTAHELGALMGTLVGGWPEGMSDDLTVRLSGRIDRKETRTVRGGTRIRLIDYKTGQPPTIRQAANDLQLVCYQLGLAFPEQGDVRLEDVTPVAQSALFHVACNDTPAESYAPEGAYQPALFTGGTLNAEAFMKRFHYPSADKLLDMPHPHPERRPEGLHDVSDEAWREFASLDGTQALWALTMIARVFYAAAASRSATIVAHPTARHIGRCRMKDVCPACAGAVDTIFETRLA
ncbi:PD-(D/E)XK nuclease family protein [Bifidobacterium sp. CP2]|uniref:PD-(D/E)XK nuclease family protein n=1 Tax=Bifidobacterium sp. CP2 TaxID=2809025 RepID=UPI001BDC9DA6|nr:PD-(D/E)XK nuclease family protein [Bifidobacterium sp. CP2]MBT1182179.1 PD-(D/E)XK nuclease family protein [Bifidobacterium sp. CP2]